jgi:hypothetical protein
LKKQISLYNKVPATRHALVSIATRIEGSIKASLPRRDSRRPERTTESLIAPSTTSSEAGTSSTGPEGGSSDVTTGSNRISTVNAPSAPRAGYCQRCRTSQHNNWGCPEVTCYKCDKKGHFASKCPELRGNANAPR